MSDKVILALFDSDVTQTRALTLFKLIGMRVERRFFDVADDSIRVGMPASPPGIKRKYGIVCDEADYEHYKKIYHKCKESYTSHRLDSYSKALWDELYE